MHIDERQLIKGEIADYYYDAEGILYSFSKNPKRTVSNIRANSALVQQITGNQKVPLLIFISRSPVPDKETRQLSQQLLPQNYSAMAMVGPPGLSTFILHMLFRLQKPPIPIRIFSNETKAREWLIPFAKSKAN